MENHKVSLGCSTLILIALIVMIFSGSSAKDVKNDVSALRSDVSRMSVQLDRMQKQLDEINAKLPASAPAAPKPE